MTPADLQHVSKHLGPHVKPRLHSPPPPSSPSLLGQVQALEEQLYKLQGTTDRLAIFLSSTPMPLTVLLIIKLRWQLKSLQCNPPLFNGLPRSIKRWMTYFECALSLSTVPSKVFHSPRQNTFNVLTLPLSPFTLLAQHPLPRPNPFTLS